MTPEAITIAGSFLLVLGGLVYMLVIEPWQKRRERRNTEVAAGRGTSHERGGLGRETSGGDLSDPALREDGQVEWLESIPTLGHEPERSR